MLRPLDNATHEWVGESLKAVSGATLNSHGASGEGGNRIAGSADEAEFNADYDSN